jgi:hypothetical protein
MPLTCKTLCAAAEKGSSILIDEVVPGGHAAQAGVLRGDALLATTARSQVCWGFDNITTACKQLSTFGGSMNFWCLITHV